MTLPMKLKNMMMIGKDRIVFRDFEQSKITVQIHSPNCSVRTVVSSSNFKNKQVAMMECY